ncbi:hypothetical protein HMPREF1548_05506 [Clostridium sp. KLE 1755]|nr:hypothetical protein HMPREF1548_05506 [Clostridium sp. KLE 1755]
MHVRGAGVFFIVNIYQGLGNFIINMYQGAVLFFDNFPGKAALKNYI